MKLTKRKGFNFFRSYFDVYNELDTDKDRLDFINALLERQFLGVKPTNLKGMAKFAYISQTNSIDSQVKGYEDKTKSTLLTTPTVGGTQGGRQGGQTPPTLQVEVEVEEKEQYTMPVEKINFSSLLDFINKTLGKSYRVINSSVKSKYNARLKDGYLKEDFSTAITNSVKDKFHKDNNFKYLTIEYFSRSATLDKYCNNGIAEKKVVKGAEWKKNPYDLTFAKQGKDT